MGPYPVPGRRTDTVSAPASPIRAARSRVQKAEREQHRRLRSQFACRNRFVRPRELQGQSFSSCASGVEKFAVRAAKTLTKGQGVLLTRRETRGHRATPSERPKHSSASAAVLDQRGDDIRAKTRWWKKSTTRSSKNQTTR